MTISVEGDRLGEHMPLADSDHVGGVLQPVLHESPCSVEAGLAAEAGLVGLNVDSLAKQLVLP